MTFELDIAAPPEPRPPPEPSEAEQAGAARTRAAVATARSVKHETPAALAPQIFVEDDYKLLPGGTQWRDPEGNLQTKPYEVKLPEDYRRVPEGAQWADPEGGLHTKPTYGDIGFTAQALYSAAHNDKEKKKALELVYPGKVKQDPTGDLYVQDGERLLKPRGFLSSPVSTSVAMAAPVAGAIAGEVGGAALGGAAGNVPGAFAGAVAGAAAGGAAGQAFNDVFLKMLGVYDRTAGEEATGLALSGAFGGAGTAAGRLVGAKAALTTSAVKMTPQGVAATALGVDPEGLGLAIQMKQKGLKYIPVSVYAKEAPQLSNIIESYDRVFHQWEPLYSSAKEYYEKQTGELLGKMGVPKEQLEAIGGLAEPRAAVPTKATGKKIIDAARQKYEEAIAPIHERFQKQAADLQARQGEAPAAHQMRLRVLEATAREARAEASRFINQVYRSIEADTAEGFQRAKVGHNSGDLWEGVASKFAEIKRVLSEHAKGFYDGWRAQYGDIMPGTAGLAEDAERFVGLLPAEFKSRNPDLIRSLAKLTGTQNEAGEVVHEATEMSLAELHRLRTQFRNEIDWRDLQSDVVNGAKKLFEGKVNRVLQGVPEAGPVLRDIDQWYGREFEIFGDKRIASVVRGLEGGEPADPRVLYDVLIREGRTDLNQRIQKMVGPNLWAGIRAADTDALMRSAMTETEGVVDGGAFIRGVLDRHRSGMLTSIHGREAAERMLQQVRDLKMLDGKLPVEVKPGDRVADVMKRVQDATAALRAEAKTDPLALLSREMKATRAEGSRAEASATQPLREGPMGFLYKPTVGAEEAMETILPSAKHLYAAEQMFGRESEEFKSLQQAWLMRILHNEMDPTKRLISVTPEIQRLMAPGVAYDDLQVLAREMHELMGTRGIEGDTARGMAAQSRVGQPTNKELPMPKWVAKTPGLSFVARTLLGGYYGVIREVMSKQSTMEWLKSGLRSRDPEVLKQTRDALKAKFRKYMDRGGEVGAAVGEYEYQAPTE